MRSKRRSSCVPAMYNDLSQSSQQPDSLLDTQSCDVALVTCANSTSIVKDEEALLEPPSPISKEQAQEMSDTPVQSQEAPIGNRSSSMKEGHISFSKNCISFKEAEADSSTIGELMKKDLKLRSRACVQVTDAIVRRRSARKSSTKTEASDSSADSESSATTQE